MTKNLLRSQRFLNTIFTHMVLMGMIPGAHLIRVPGRKSGLMHTTPIFVLKHEGHRWLVSGFGQSDWVKNLHAAGCCILIHDRREERVTVVEINDPKTRAPILQAFARRSPVGDRGFSIKRSASLEEFVAIAPYHPVFRIEEDNKSIGEQSTIMGNTN
jgi:deazaflavin-dependent oxidoreductase (nitroreductase family)